MAASESCALEVWIAHPDPVIRRGVKAILDELRTRIVVALLDPAAEPDELFVNRRGVLVTDVVAGVKIACAQRRFGGPSILRVIVIAKSRERFGIKAVLGSGVLGCLMSGFAEQALIDAVHIVARGSPFLCRGAARQMADVASLEALTTRELEVLRYVIGGHANKEIAAELDICVGTVKAHVKAVFAKFDVSNRTQAACVATERGIAPLRRSSTSRLAATPRLLVGASNTTQLRLPVTPLPHERRAIYEQG